MHIERGQVYICYAFLFALSYNYFKSTGKYHEFISGFIIGILLLMRPLAGVFMIPFLLIKMKKWLYGWVTGVIVGCLLFVAPRPSLWQDYFFAMQSRLIGTTIKHTILKVADSTVYPGIIEGMGNINTYSVFNAGNLNSLHNYFESVGINITMNQSMLIYSCIGIILSAFFYRAKTEGGMGQELFLFGYLLYLLSEVFTAAPRSTYCLIEWSPAFFIMIRKMQKNNAFILFIMISLLMLHAFPFNFPYQFDIAELMLVLSLVYTIFEQMIIGSLKIRS
jgi:hypothetical protein